MLNSIPSRILTTKARLNVPYETDKNGKALYHSYDLTKTHLQPSNGDERATDNDRVLLKSILFVDSSMSRPKGLNFNALKIKADELGAKVEIIINNISYYLATIETILDDRGKIHHWELELC